MGNEQIIDEVVSPVTNKQIDDLGKGLDVIDGKLVKAAISANLFNDTLLGAKTFTDYSNKAKAAAVEQDKFNKVQEQGRLQQIRIEQQREKNIDQYNKENSAFAQLTRAYKEQLIATQNIGVALGTNSKEFKEATAATLAYGKQITDINKPLDVLQNNASRYSNGIIDAGKKAFGAIRFLANILPNFGIGTAFLLIFEGIKLVAEKLDLFNSKISLAESNLKNFNEVAKAANIDLGKSQTVFKILTDTAANTALSLKERTAAGAELIKQFPKELEGSTALSIANGEEKKRLDELSASLVKNARARAALSKIQEIQGKILNEEFQKQKIQNAQSNELDRLGKGIASGQIDTTGAGIDEQTRKAAILKRARTAALESDQRKKDLEQQQAFLVKFAGGEAAIAKVIETDDKKKDAVKKVDNTDEESLKKQISNQKEIAENDKLSYRDRVAAAQNFYDLSNQLAELHSKKEISLKKKASDVFSLEDANRLAAHDETIKLIDKIDKDQADRAIKDVQDALSEQKIETDSRLSELKRANETANDIQQDYRNKEADEIERQYREGLISKQQQNDKLLALDDAHNVARLARLLATEESALKILQDAENNAVGTAQAGGASESQVQGIRNNSGVGAQKTVVANVRRQLKTAQGKQSEDDNAPSERERIARLKTAATIISAVSELTQDASRLAQAGYQNEIDLLEKKKQAIQDTADREIQAVNNSIASEKTKQNQINVIQAKAAANQRKIDSEIRQEKRKAAVSEKEFNIISAVEKTALAVVNTLASLPAPGNFVAAALVGALGAAEIATIIAQPIPKFADGVTNFRGGIARYGEAGTEIVHEPGKAPYLTTGDTIGFLPRGTDVYSHAELLQMARPASVYARDREQIGWKEVVAAIKEQKQPPQKRPVVIVNTGNSGYGLRR